jgi:molybdopterin/thiamine biosynthesis adenylyltransferase
MLLGFYYTFDFIDELYLIKIMSENFKRVDNQKDIVLPDFFRLSDSSSKLSLNALLSGNPHISITDQIDGQIRELIKSRYPEGLEIEILESKVKSVFGSKSTDEYGVWVFYPWLNKLVHILDENEFIELRTNRNCNKITTEEQKILSSKRIGIMGLSVGQSIALTLAMERGCGELRLADFDQLELSNLNRIRTPLYNLGELKVVATAREIAEIDPFIKVKIYTEGITEENIEDFMFSGGKLDLFVDECDGLDMKVYSREFAKKNRIPVIMDTSDRGMIDVERFDLTPDMPILHGRLDGIDSNTLKGLSNEEKIPIVLRILDFEKLSNRAKSSLAEVKKTITTWPQLATSVILGGAVGADVSRRILLNQFRDSGRYYVDIESIIKNE